MKKKKLLKKIKKLEEQLESKQREINYLEYAITTEDSLVLDLARSSIIQKEALNKLKWGGSFSFKDGELKVPKGNGFLSLLEKSDYCKKNEDKDM